MAVDALHHKHQAAAPGRAPAVMCGGRWSASLLADMEAAAAQESLHVDP